MGSIAPSKSGTSETSFEDLPHETAIDTFLRLPVKALVRSTFVSKSWSSLIAKPCFVSAQIRRSISCSDETAVLIVPADISKPDKKYCSLISVETGSVIDKYEIPFDTMSGTLILVESVNGLLFLTDLESQHGTDLDNQHACQNYYLWNPSTRKYKSLDFSYLADRSALGFGFHEPTHDYRVIWVEYPADNERNECGKLAPKVEVFSLQKNKWSCIGSPIVPRVVRGSGTTINSIVYWLDNEQTRTYLEEVWILSFDFNNELFGQLKLPNDVRYCLGEKASFKLMMFEGSLSVCVHKVSRSTDGSHGLSVPCCIWLMRQEDSIISWTIRFRVVLNKLVWPYKITRHGALIMMTVPHENPGRSIMSCDLKSMHYKYLVYDNPVDENVFVPATVDTCFIESLVMHVGGDELLKSAK